MHHALAACSHAKQVCPSAGAVWPKGRQRDLAAPERPREAASSTAGSLLCGPVRSLTASSHSMRWHQGASTMLPPLSASTNSVQPSATCSRASRSRRARSSMAAWMSSSACRTASGMLDASGTSRLNSFSRLSRRANTTTSRSTSLGPTSMRSGTPFCSHELYFQPAVTLLRSSSSTRMPASRSSREMRSAVSVTCFTSSGAVDARKTGTTTTCTGATRGGSTSPWSSPCTMTITPMVRVVRPHEFCHASADPPSSVSNEMLNMRAKFCPRLWLVAPWIARPVAGTNASTVVVYRPPANFSTSDLRPLMTGTASSSSYTRA
mmetsp:Transcript_11407/g.36436  ORF Transcript_11407/g.36436 Transcript_11407/m.36436 type:complete len:321 (-) Transcript_11407:620-1582(-)